eukprot:scaffold10714_cov157-Isochrysis_galbana.AAC.2
MQPRTDGVARCSQGCRGLNPLPGARRQPGPRAVSAPAGDALFNGRGGERCAAERRNMPKAVARGGGGGSGLRADVGRFGLLERRAGAAAGPGTGAGVARKGGAAGTPGGGADVKGATPDGTRGGWRG